MRCACFIVFIYFLLVTTQFVKAQSNFVKIYDQEYDQLMSGIIQTKSNHLLLSGRTGGLDGNVFTYLVKTDLTGMLLWAKKFGTAYHSIPDITSGIMETVGGFIIMSNVYQSNHPLLYKVDEEGKVLWANQLKGPSGFNALSMSKCSDGGYIIAGEYPIMPSYINMDILLIKTDPDGNELWQQKYGLAEKDDRVVTVIESSDGGFVVAGSTKELRLYEDVLIFKTDKRGTVLWKKIIGGEEQNIAMKMVKTHDKNYAIAINESTSNFLSMLKFTETGELAWHKKIITPQSVTTNTMALLNSGDFIVAGQSWSQNLQSMVMVVSSEGELISQREYAAIGKSSRCFDVTVRPSGDPLITGMVNYLDFFVLGVSPDGCMMNDINLGADKESCGEAILLKAGGGYTSYKWNTGSTSNPLTVGSSGTFVVTVENPDHCFRTDSIKVTFKSCILRDTCKNRAYNDDDLFVPNIITPNGDEKNEYFKVADSIEGSALKVFNRWGAVVYHNEKYNSDWNGDDLSVGNYYYVLENKCFTKTIKGNLMIMK